MIYAYMLICMMYVCLVSLSHGLDWTGAEKATPLSTVGSGWKEFLCFFLGVLLGLFFGFGGVVGYRRC